MRRTEPLSGGLVTVIDPMLLSPGQLSAMQNVTYYPSDPALHRSKGRAVFGVVSAQAIDVVGLRDMTFDNGDRYLIAHASSNYYTATAGDVGTFALMTGAVASGAQLEVVHYRNRFFLMNGAQVAGSATGTVNSNLVAYLSATAATTPPSIRQHGMLPVNSQPTVVTAGLGTFSQSVTGYYEYWTTEVIKYQQDGADAVIESTYDSKQGPATVLISATAVSATIPMPTLRNPQTTHWRIYRSPRKDSASDVEFPTGFMIAEVSTATAQVVDTQTAATASALPTTWNGNADSATFFIDAGSPTNLTLADGNYATLASTLKVDKGQGLYGYNLGGFKGQVVGVEVEVKAYVSSGSAPAMLRVTIGKNRQATGDYVAPLPNLPVDTSGMTNDLRDKIVARKTQNVTATSSGTANVLTYGGPTDRWFASNQISLADTDFSTGGFMVVLSTVGFSAQTVSIDYAKVKVYYGATINSTIQFPTVVYTFGDISAQVGKNGPPPSSSTADLFEDILVCNDVSNPSMLRYSFPGDTDAFPATYYLDFETRENDRVTLVKRCGSHLVVALDTSLWRVNYLPSERDASFDRGKAIDPITRTHGVINPMCAASFTRDGGHEEVAFISQKGLHSTDSYSFNTRSGNLDWRTHFPVGATAIALVNDPENERLMFFLRNDANGNESYLRYDFSYAKGDVDGKGNFKISGPTHMRNFDSGSSGRADLKSAWAVPRSSGDTSVYFGYGGSSVAAGAGKVYLETGTTIPAQDSTMRFTTRRMYLGGLGAEWRANYLLGYSGSYAADSPTANYTLLTTKTNDTGETTGPSKSITLAGQRLHRVELAGIAEGARISAIVTATNYQQELLVIDGDNFGEADSGRS